MNAVAANTSLLLLVSLVSLALPSGAGAFRWDEDPGCDESPHPPKISYRTTSMDTFQDPGEFFDVLYGEDITSLCTGDAANLRVQRSDKHLKINEHGAYLETEGVNSTTIKWIIKRPDVDRVRYRCVDTVSECQDSLYFMIAPRASVAAAGVRRVMHPDPIWDTRFIFFVPHGETYQIFCTGSDAKSLKIHLNSWTLLPTIAVNETTAMYEGRADQVDTFYYTCSGAETAWFDIIVDYPPEALQFQCTSYNHDKLACTWRSLSTMTIFNLFYGKSKLLCSDRYGGTDKECKWSKRNIWHEAFFQNYDTTLGFVMQTCNRVFCRNQTFLLPHIAIVKLDPVSNLTVIAKSSRAAIVAWSAPREGYSRRHSLKRVYKAEYRLLQKRWRQADASSVRCDFKRCELGLKLDCPEQHYELRVYARLEAVTEDRLWSEPAAVSFYTSRAPGDAPEPACRAALREPELASKETAIGELFKLISRTVEEKLTLRRRVRDMRIKLDVMTSLLDASSGQWQ